MAEPKHKPFKVAGQSLHNFYIEGYPAENEWGIPEMTRQDFCLADAKWQSFSENRTCKCGKAIIHMFNEDYAINSAWSTPNKYLRIFSKVRAVCTPDFSLYTDMPRALWLFNVYRKQWLGRFWQENGINVICTVSWPEGMVEDFMLAGIPQGATIAMSVCGKDIDIERQKADIGRILQRLNPAKVYVKAGSSKAEYLSRCFEFETIPRYLTRSEQNGQKAGRGQV